MIQPTHHSGLRQADVILALSLATDLGTGRPMEWAMRSALLGVRLGASLGLSDADMRGTYYCALLAYVGCTSEVHLAVRLFGDDPATAIASIDFVDQGNPQEMEAWMMNNIGVTLSPDEREHTIANVGSLITQYKLGHCEVAVRLAERLGLEPSIRHALWHMGEKWNGEGVPNGVRGEAIPVAMRVALLVRDVEPHLNTHGVDAAIAIARQRGGVIHDPVVAARFCEQAQSLCATLEHDATWEGLLVAEPMPRTYSDEDFDEAALVFADFADLISPWFTAHSRNVADLAEAAANAAGLPAADAKMIRRAALMHDVGKVAVPHGYWHRDRPLKESEWERVRLHPYYAERILARPAALAQLAAIAGSHHERTDGSGYFRNLSRDRQSLAVRLLACANFYRARVEARPNRPAIQLEAAAQLMRQEVRAGRLDGDAVRCVLEAAGHHVTPARRDQVAGLSQREIEVLRLLAHGMTNKQMAAQLSVSEKTVGTHVMHIYEKIGCSTRSAATLFATQNGLLADSGLSA
jgi:HD-GYP domain-containing protein (c-di-GMP phosphodiesterase class II)